MNVNFKLENFEGPLDLLLFLIQKHKLNIYDIPIISLVEQYLECIESISDDMDYAGEFLEMAARLIYIKTVSLLPRHEEAQKLREELQGRLIEYSLCKETAAKLRERYLAAPYTVRAPMDIKSDAVYEMKHDPMELVFAARSFAEKPVKETLTSAVFTKFVSKTFVSVTSKMLYVIKTLYQTGRCSLSAMFDSMTDRSERVAAFLAVLELTRNGRILLSDDNSEIFFNRDYTGGDTQSQFDAPVNEDNTDETK
ncbi:MAG: segregation/condensation protein A [Oscillospiraceae bacterium]|nr:segregation/condensation protein A [Oscillospiraceae bacterium]